MAPRIRVRRIVVTAVGAFIMAACSGGAQVVTHGAVTTKDALSASCTAPARPVPKAALDGPLAIPGSWQVTGVYNVTKTGLGFDHDEFLTNRTSHPLVLDSVYLTGQPGIPTPIVFEPGS